jgi:O-antigen ligase
VRLSPAALSPRAPAASILAAARRAALRGLQSLWAYLIGLVSALREESPSLAPFRRQRSARQDKFRRRLLLAFIALVGAIYGFLVSIFPMGFYLYLAGPIALIVLMVVWALPDSQVYPQVTMERLFFAVFLATFLWPNYLAIALPGLPWITLTRVLGLPLLLIMLVSLSISAEFRARIAAPFETSPLMMKFMLAFVAIQVLTLPLSNHIADSVNAFLDAQFAWTAMFFIAAVLFGKRGRPQMWVGLFCAMALLLCFLAIVEQAKGAVLWAGNVPSLLQVPDESVQRIMAGGRRSALGIYRLQGTFGTSLNFAEFLGLCTPYFLYLLATVKSLPVRLLVLAYLPFSFWVIRGTDSRLGVVAFFAAILLSILLWSLKNWIHRRQDMVSPLVVLTYPLLAGAFLALTFVWQRLGRMVWGGGAQQASTEGRKEQYANAIPKIVNWPFGNGIGEGAITLGDTNRMGVLTIDSYYLVLALEYGVIGFCVYAGLIFTGIGQAVKYGLKSTSEEADLLIPAAVLLAVFVIVKGVMAGDDNHILVFMTLGMVVALAHKVRGDLHKAAGQAA